MPFPSGKERLGDLRVLIFDVYGTLFNYWKPEFAQESTKQKALLESFKSTISYFEMGRFLMEMNPDVPPEKTLWDLYHGLISLKRNLLLEKNIESPEVKIEEVWHAINLMLKRRGYSFTKMGPVPDDEFARCVAYYYNFQVFEHGLYPDVADSLLTLKKMNLMFGILSNAQFYTPIDLTLMLRDQSNGRIEDKGELFETDLEFYSFEYGIAKPSEFLLRKLFDALYECRVLPSQTLFVGNDLASDIKPAMEAGMKTALFVGDDQCAFIYDLAQGVVPDISFSSWNELPRRVSFYG